jgi:hypothetical protein
MYTEIEQEALDIDWFFTDGKYISFMASGGGKLPNSVSASKEDNQLLVNYFRNLPEISDVEINTELDNLLIKIFGSGVNDRYLEDYISMAKKGLYSFDKTHPNNFLEPHYHLVAKPINPLNLKDLPQDIQDILLRTKYNKKLESIQELNILEI